MNFLTPIIKLLTDTAMHCKTVFSTESNIDFFAGCTRQYLAVLCVSLVVGILLFSLLSLAGRRRF